MRRLLRGKIESAHYVRKWTRTVCYLRLRIRSETGFLPENSSTGKMHYRLIISAFFQEAKWLRLSRIQFDNR
ncbi:hypothetical protein EMD78_18325 [Citrobacter portucalensis]